MTELTMSQILFTLANIHIQQFWSLYAKEGVVGLKMEIITFAKEGVVVLKMEIITFAKEGVVGLKMEIITFKVYLN